MRAQREQSRAAQVIQLVIAAYLSVFVSWTAPHHTESHCRSSLTFAGSLGEAVAGGTHHPDRCQLCRMHGQLDAAACEAAALSPARESSPLATIETSSFASVSLLLSTSRAPPVVA